MWVFLYRDTNAHKFPRESHMSRSQIPSCESWAETTEPSDRRCNSMSRARRLIRRAGMAMRQSCRTAIDGSISLRKLYRASVDQLQQILNLPNRLWEPPRRLQCATAPANTASGSAPRDYAPTDSQRLDQRRGVIQKTLFEIVSIEARQIAIGQGATMALGAPGWAVGRVLVARPTIAAGKKGSTLGFCDKGLLKNELRPIVEFFVI